MVKGLVNKLKNTFKIGLLAGALAFGYVGGSGCVDNGIEPPKIIPKQKPVAVMTAAPMSGYAPLPVGFNFKSYDPDGGDIMSHTLMLGNGKDSTVTANPFNYTYSDTGNYKVGVVAKDDEGTASDTTWLPQNIVVGKAPNQNPVIQYTASPKAGYAPLNVHVDGRASFDSEGGNLIWFYDYTNDNVADDSSGAVIDIPYLTPGTYTLAGWVRDNEGALSPKKLETIVVTERPDQIAFWSWDDIYKGYIIKTSSGKDTLVNITKLTTDPGQDLYPAWSPNGQELAFTSNRTNKLAIWKMDENGNSEVDISSNIVERASQPDWGSNGKIVVAYTDKNEAEAGIGIINSEGTSFTPIYTVPARQNLPGGSNPSQPKLSPDGTKIVFVDYIGGNFDIYTGDLTRTATVKDTLTHVVNLSNHPADEGSPNWSPDGSKIIFFSHRSGNSDLWEMDATGGNVKQITADTGIEDDAEYFSDGTKILFVHDIDFSAPKLYTIDADGSNWTQLTSTVSRYPSWRPKP